MPVNAAFAPPFLDVTGDGSVSPIDAVLVINWLNANPPTANAGEGEPLLSQPAANEEAIQRDALFAALAADLDSPPVRGRRTR